MKSRIVVMAVKPELAKVNVLCFLIYSQPMCDRSNFHFMWQENRALRNWAKEGHGTHEAELADVWNQDG